MRKRCPVAALAAVTLALPSVAACDRGPPQDLFVETSIQVRYDGSLYTFTRWFACIRESRANRFSPRIKHYRYRQTNRLFTAKLNSGEGILFIVPNYCERAVPSNYPDGKWRFPTRGLDSSPYIPLILIADNAENPSFLEAYVTDAVTNDPSSRLRVLSFSAQYSERREAELSDPAVAMPWLRGIRGQLTWHANFVFVFSKKAWQDNEELLGELGKIRKPQVLGGKASKLSERIGQRIIPPSPDSRSGVAPERPPCDPPERAFDSRERERAWQERCLRRISRTAGLRRTGKRPRRRLVVDRTAPLRIRYYSSKAPLDCIKKGTGIKTYCLELRPGVVLAPFFTNDTYDPQTEEIFVIFSDSIRLWDFMKEAPRGRINSPSDRSLPDSR